MKKHQKNKDLEKLNILIKELKPCVLKKDIPCIRKYLATEKNEPALTDAYREYVYPIIEEENEVLLKELEACLDYDKLLPHMLGLRGVDRVCIIPGLDTPLSGEIFDKKQEDRGREIRIMGVAFPEAVRIGDDSDIYYAP